MSRLESQVLLWVSSARESLKFMGRGGAAECCAQEMEISESTGTSVKCGMRKREKEREGKSDQGETRTWRAMVKQGGKH